MKRLYRKIVIPGMFLLVVGISGCSAPESESPQGTAEHEILTLTPVESDKTMITLRGTDGVQVWEMEKAIEKKFPDVDIVVTNNTWIQKDLANNCYQDIVLVANSTQVSWNSSDNFIDLSGESFTQNYYLSAMWESAAEDGLFFLPGPSNIYGIVYNKDLFSKYGWEVPETLDDFISLCETIEAQGIRAIQPALYYTDAGRQFFTGFTYEPIFAGVNNNIWHEDYRSGKAGMEGHMEPAFDIMQRFLDAGILRPEDYEIMPSERSEMMYKAQSCAMILETQDAVKYCTDYAGEDAPEIGMLPFLSGNGPNSDYLLSVPNYFIAANKALQNPGNEEKLAKVMDILAYMSTIEGQRAVASPDSTRISSVRGSQWEYNDFLEGVKDTIEKGNVVKQPFFVGDYTTDVDRQLKEDMLLFSQGNITAEEVMRDLDKTRDRVLTQEDEQEKTKEIGTAAKTFSVLQTAQLFADIFKVKADAQIGLCMANTKMGGCFFKLYQGDLAYGGKADNSLEYYIEEGFLRTNDEEDENKLLKIIMTGENLVKSLNEIYASNEFYPDAYWVASGLKITFAPWAEEGSRIVNVTLADGTAIDMKKTYTVAVWNNSVNPDLITEVVSYYDDPITDLFRERVEAEESIKPEMDDYFIIDWSVM